MSKLQLSQTSKKNGQRDMKTTTSLCPICYKKINATIETDFSGIVMKKSCDMHGNFEAVVEKDILFYTIWSANNAKNIYEGHLVDVTKRCNLNCKYCYYKKTGKDVANYAILAECNKTPGPYILTGGEPTLREDLPDLLSSIGAFGPTYFLTNGTGLLDRRFLQRCARHTFKYDKYTGIGLSYHKEFAKFNDVIENLRSEGIRPTTLFFVIDNILDLYHVKSMAEKYKDLFYMVRIKCASRIWNENKTSKIYSSDVIKWFMQQGETLFPPKGKITYLPFTHNGVLYSVINWYDITNVDLGDIDCTPTYTAQDGTTTDFVQAMLINEGIEKGWLNGERLW